MTDPSSAPAHGSLPYNHHTPRNTPHSRHVPSHQLGLSWGLTACMTRRRHHITSVAKPYPHDSRSFNCVYDAIDILYLYSIHTHTHTHL